MDNVAAVASIILLLSVRSRLIYKCYAVIFFIITCKFYMWTKFYQFSRNFFGGLLVLYILLRNLNTWVKTEEIDIVQVICPIICTTFPRCFKIVKLDPKWNSLYSFNSLIFNDFEKLFVFVSMRYAQQTP